MSKVYIEPFEVYGWQGQRISCGPLRLVLAPAIGGRIISLRYDGKEFLFADKDHLGEVFDFSADQDLSARKKEMGFRLWGGDKTWVAPQHEWAEGIPPLELDAGNYALTWEEGGVAVMTSPVCRETGLRIVRRVRVDEEQTVHLSEEFQNTSSQAVHKGIWNVTQVLRPCAFYIPARKGAFRSYHEQDATLPPPAEEIFNEQENWVEVPCRTPTLFKCGGMPLEGQALIKMPLGGPRELVWLKSFTFDPEGAYGHQSVVEVFNSGSHNYAEIELHGPLVTIAPGERSVFSQQWRFKQVLHP